MGVPKWRDAYGIYFERERDEIHTMDNERKRMANEGHKGWEQI